MSFIKPIEEALHRIRIRLHPSNLPGAGKAYTARIHNEAVMGVEAVCVSMIERGGYTGNYEDLLRDVRQYHHEAMYQLCNGYAISNGFYVIQPSVGGFFMNANEEPDKERHPVRFRFRPLPRLRALADHIDVALETAPEGRIGDYIDYESGSINDMITPGGQFILTGSKIKICGKGADCGLYFVPESEGASVVKVKRKLGLNTSRKLVGIVPKLLPGSYTLRVMTQYTVGGKDLQAARAVSGGAILRVL